VLVLIRSLTSAVVSEVAATSTTLLCVTVNILAAAGRGSISLVSMSRSKQATMSHWYSFHSINLILDYFFSFSSLLFPIHNKQILGMRVNHHNKWL
jgi:hypothetical protein